VEYFLLYILVGVIVGLLSGLFGFGGAVIIIPALVWIYASQGMNNNLIMHMAAGTSLAIMIFTTASSFLGHIKRGAQVLPIYRRLVFGIIIGTIIGSVAGHFIHSDILKILFGLFILFVSVRIIFTREPVITATEKLPKPITTFILSCIIGVKSGLLGIGCGSISAALLSCWNVPIRNIIAISAACSLTVAIVGSISYMLIGLSVHNLPAYTSRP
jgi:uncharacterized protein